MISIIAALDEKSGIGKKGQLLFKIPDDFKRMKELSMGHPIIVGRKTYESIGRPLPGRTNIVVTRDNPSTSVRLRSLLALRTGSLESSDIIVVYSLNEAFNVAQESPGSEEVFIFGGGEIFKQVMEKVDRLYLTLVEGDFEADTFFPDYSEFKKVIYEKSGEYDGLRYKFLDLER